MKPFVLTIKAKSDLKAIALYTEKNWGRELRNHYINKFDNTFHLIANNPSMGKACNNIKDGYRKFPHASHIVFYRNSTTSVIEIIRILHKSMDSESRLHDS